MTPIKRIIPIALTTLALAGCAAEGFNLQNSTASKAANIQADKALNKPVEYKNKAIRGPTLVVLPGKIKSNNATFTQKVSANNIADFGELELGLANFRVLERSDMGPLLEELTLAVNLGNSRSVRKFKRGRFKSTNFFVKFDVLKAEKAATAGTSFDGRAIGNILGNLSGTPGQNNIANTLGSSVQLEDSSGIWIIGMRYKVLHASTTEQIFTGYVEEKIEVGAKKVSVLGITQTQSGGTSMDSAIQKLVQKLVQEIDEKGKNTKRKKRSSGNASLKRYQKILNNLGYNAGRPDGLSGKKTRSAISNFQKDYRIPANGKLNAKTKAKLDSLAK